MLLNPEMKKTITIREKLKNILVTNIPQNTKESYMGFLFGLQEQESYYVLGSYLNETSSPNYFEMEYNKAIMYLPTGCKIFGIFFKTNQADLTLMIQNLCKHILPKDSTLLNKLQFNEILILALDEKLHQEYYYWYNIDNQQIESANIEIVSKINITESFVKFRIKAYFTVKFAHSDDSIQRRDNLDVEITNLINLVNSPLITFKLQGSKLFKSENEVSVNQFNNLIDFTENEFLTVSEWLKNSGDGDRNNFRNDSTQQVHVIIQNTGKYASEHYISAIPIILHDHTKFTGVEIPFNIDTLVIAHKDDEVSNLLAMFSESIQNQLQNFASHICSNVKGAIYHIPTSYHFTPEEFNCGIMVTYPDEINDQNLIDVRTNLHKRFQLPLNCPYLRKSCAINISSHLPSQYLLNVHIGLPASKVVGGVMSLVQGRYEYRHYMQDRFDDNGWGCAYRSLQTIASWFILQGYSEISVPTHSQIQQALVDCGDKPSQFIGSKQWIGSTEVSYVLSQLYKVDSKICFVSSGLEMESKARELANHFQTQGTPVMIGGGVLAHTILGVDWNEGSGQVKFLILDPHYTGVENLKVIQDKVWCGWKGIDFWNANAFYNMCMPQRPYMI